MILDDFVLPYLHVDDVVADIFLKYKEKGNIGQWSGKLLEINPFCWLTDPCLFDSDIYEKGLDKFEFRILEK